ncbi:hypothetical protein PX699_30485 [Sphingobium sp. H39-3-25]|uniref:hypothetical protein n=1 Tax=Sphingobium arseniciresistens TaxID=3030834 RepID=UPI0023BA2086|nr:hypothetical protein [Sphingobium arseniciresistens]
MSARTRPDMALTISAPCCDGPRGARNAPAMRGIDDPDDGASDIRADRLPSGQPLHRQVRHRPRTIALSGGARFVRRLAVMGEGGAPLLAAAPGTMIAISTPRRACSPA